MKLKIFKIFLQSISLKKHFEIFSENSKKNFLPKKKTNRNNFFKKIRPDISFGFNILSAVCLSEFVFEVHNKQIETCQSTGFQLTASPPFRSFSKNNKGKSLLIFNFTETAPLPETMC